MDAETYFSEKQQFRQIWLWTLLLGLDVLILYGIFRQVLHKQQFGNQPMSNGALLGVAAVMILLSFLFFIFRLDTEIKSDGIYVRLFPFMTFRKYSWDKIAASFVRQYNPIREYGGWGIRISLTGNGRAWNVSGNKGIQLVFSNNAKLLIGTRKPDEAREALRKAEHLSSGISG